LGVLDLTRRVIPAMLRAGSGVICNIGSCGVYSPLPFYSSYRTSKAALSALSEGLRIELAPFGIRVLEVPIGGVDTDMLQSSIAVRSPEAIAFPPYQPMAERIQVNARSGKTNATAPGEAARRIIDAIYTDGPLRRPCDENAEVILHRVEESTEEERMSGMLKAFGL
jgi:short-subunit dehydrogenase